MSKHTPGPWDYWQGAGIGDESHAEIIAADGEIVIAGFNNMIEQGEANARLIAAAPDLLEALVDSLCALEVCGRDFDHVMGKARAAIAKAKGEAQ